MNRKPWSVPVSLVMTIALQGGLMSPAWAVTATKSGTPSPVPQGGTITYTNTITNGGGGATDLTNVQFTDPDPANTSMVAGSLRTTPIAQNDRYDALGNVNLTIAAANGLLANDYDLDDQVNGVTPANSVTPGTFPTTQGGSVIITLDGGFTYSPPAGYTGDDTFSYTLNDNDGKTDTGTATVAVSGMIWFINPSAAAGGNGTLAKPFNTLAAFQAINNGVATGGPVGIVKPKINQAIFLYESATSYAGGIKLLAGQKLIGQDATQSLATLAGVTVPAGSAPLPAMDSGNTVYTTIVNATSGGSAIEVANNALVDGLRVGSASGSGIKGTGVNTVTLGPVPIAGTGGPALDFSGNATGNISYAGAITTTAGVRAVSIANRTGGNITLNGSMLGAGTGVFFSNNTGSTIVLDTVLAGVGVGVTIDSSASTTYTIKKAITGANAIISMTGNGSGANVTFEGAISGTGSRIALSSNTGSTIKFDGQLTLNTSTDPAFAVSGGGTVSAKNTLNTITTTTGAALNVTNTTIGADNLVFKSIASNGASSAIVLNNTGTSGSLLVNGNGNTSVGGDNSGGTIQNSSSDAIVLTSTLNPSFTNVNIQGTGGSGVNGTQVNGFTFKNGKISGAGNAGSESALSFNGNPATASNVTGVLTVTGNQFTNPYYSGVDVQSGDGNVLDAVITNNSIVSDATNGNGSGINFVGVGTASTAFTLTKATISGNTITEFNCGIQINTSNAGNGPAAIAGLNASNKVVISTNSVTPKATGTHAIAIVNSTTGSTRAQTNFDISNNPAPNGILKGSSGGHVVLIGNNGNSDMAGTISGNTINANHTAAFGGNGISGGNGVGGAGNAWTPSLTLSVTSNTVTGTDGNGILLVGRGTNGTARFKIAQNNVGKPLSGNRPGIRVDAGNSSSLNDRVYLNIYSNTSLGSGASEGIGIRKEGTNSTVNIFGLYDGTSSPPQPSHSALPNSPTVTQVEAFLEALNPSGGGGFVINGDGYVRDTTQAPQLMLAKGGVPAEPAVEPKPAAAPSLPVEVSESVPTVVEQPVHAVATTPEMTPQGEKEVSSFVRQAELNVAVAEAKARWTATGLTASQMELLEGLKFEISSLNGRSLGEANGQTLRLDDNAGGIGWFMGADSQSDALFVEAASSTRSYTEPGSAAAGRIDLLTTIMHEMGHALGLHDSYEEKDRDSLMYGFLTMGERRLPAKGQAEGAVPHAHQEPHFLTAPLVIPVLPAGKSIVITYDVVVNNPVLPVVQNVTSMGTVSGTGINPSVNTNQVVTALNIPPAFTSAALNATIQTGFVYNHTFTATGAPIPTFAVTTGSLPNGLSLAPGGAITGTPTAGGTFTGVVTASNGVSPAATQNFSITVNQPPAITSAANTTFAVGTSGTFSVTATGYPTAGAITLSHTGALPNGVNFVDNDNGTATLVGTPDPNTGGSYPITITANNGISPNATQNFTLTVNQAPAITSVANATFTAGTAGSFEVTTTGFPSNATMVISQTGALPDGVEFVNNGNGKATIFGTPAANAGGIYPITITANNGISPNATQNFTLTVNQAPAITSVANATFTTGAAGSFTVTTTGYPSAGAIALSRSGALPDGVDFIDNGDGTARIWGTPAANAGGVYPITITANNGVSPNATQNFTLTVNQAPAITSSDAVAFTETITGTFDVTTTGFSATGPMTIIQNGALPSGVIFTDNGDGTAKFTGAPALGTAGNFPITITANNGVSPNATQNFTLTVKPPVNNFLVSVPSDVTAGVPFSVTVTARDDMNATVTGYTGPVHFTSSDAQAVLPANSSLTNGVGTFSVTLKTAGSGRTVTVADVVLTSASGTSSGINVAAAAEAKLAFVQQPTNATSQQAIAPSVSVRVLDEFNNDTTSTASITLAIGNNPNSGTLAGTKTVAAVNGVATFPGLSIDKAGTNYTLQALSGGLTGGTSGTFNVAPGAPAKLAFSLQPANAVSNTAIGPMTPPTVDVQDAAGNKVTGDGVIVTLAIANNPNSGTLSGTATQTTFAGSAKFPSLSINKAGTGYTFTATSTGLTSVTSDPFNILPGAASKLAIVQPPTNAVAGAAIAPAVTVELLDGADNRTTSTADVTFALGANPGTGTLSGTKTVAAVNGLATFSDLSINKVGTGYTLAATSSGLTGVTTTGFDISVGQPSKLAFVQAPTDAVAGVSIAPELTVQILDANDNPTTSTAEVTVAIGTNPGSGTLSGTATVAAVNGVATFSGLSINKIGTGYTLAASSTGLTGSDSGVFNITPAAAAKLAFGENPSNAVAGVGISPAVTVRVLDSFDNLTASTAEVTVAIGTNPGSGTLSGTATVAAVDGVATFSGLSINKIGTDYTLAASSTGLTGAGSGVFNITPASPAKLAFGQQPEDTVAGAAIAPAVTVRVLDQFDNQTASTMSVSMVMSTNPGSSTLSGTTSVTAVNGVATFSDLSIAKIGSGYSLAASIPGLTSATSDFFAITPAAASQLVFGQNPLTAVAGVAINPAVTLRLLDQYGNQTTSTADVAVAIGANPGSGTLSGTATVSAVNGVATFSGLSVNKIGTGYTLAASSTGLTGANSGEFNITPAAAAKLAFGENPSNAVAGVAISPAVTVRVLDQFDNQTTSTASVTVAIGTNPGSGTLSGTATMSAVDGVATFSGLSINKVGAAYALAASSAGLTGTNSGDFNITPAAASHFALVAPANAVAGTAFPVDVTALDPFGNIATGYAGTVHFTSSDASGTLPADRTLTNGAGTVNVTLKAGGSSIVLGTDTVTSSITGASNVITVSPRVDLAITNSDSPDPVTAGQTIAYTMQVVNNGPSIALNVYVNNALPANTTFESLSAPAGWSVATPLVGGKGTVSLNKGGMTSGETATITIVVRVESSVAHNSTISDTAVISSDTIDLSPANNSATATTTVNTRTDLGLAMTDSPDPVTAGTNVTYTLSLTNVGPSDAQGVSVTDTLPAGMTFVSATAPAGWDTNSPAVGGIGAVTFTSTTLANAGAATFTIAARVNSSVAHGTTITNTANVATTTTDVNPANNSASASTTVVRSADLAVTASGSPAPEVNATTNMTYTVTLANNGPSDAANPSLHHDIPANATFVSATAPAGWTGTAPAVGGTGALDFSATTLAQGESVEFTVVVNVNATAPNNSILTGTFSAATTTADGNVANNSSQVQTTVKSGADLVITVEAAPEPVVAGTDVTYTINLVNNGPLDANNAAISDVLPVGTTFVSATASAGWTLNLPAVGSNGTITATRSQFATGATASFTVVARVESNVLAGTNLVNAVATSSDTIDVFPLNNTASATSTVTAQADLVLEMTGTPNPAVAESLVTFTLNLTNDGPSDAADAVVSNTLPSTMTFVSATPAGGWTATTPAVGSGGTISFTNPSFANNGSATFTIVAKVKAGTANGTVIDNTATVSSSSTDPSVGNNSATATTAVGTVDPTVVQIGTTATLNSQSGLFEMVVDITNTTPLPINGFRLHVDYNAYKGAHPSLRLYNASSPANSQDVYVDYPYPVLVDGKVSLKLLFYTSNRRFPAPFQPVLTVEALPTSQVPHTNGNGVQPKLTTLPDGNVMLEFPSVIGRWYRVSYSSDLTHWYDCPIPVQASGTKTQWTDSGAPFTSQPPNTPGAESRFYRVNEITTP